jgi:hypothetical protein
VSTSTRRLLSIAALAVAGGLLVLGALFQADTSPDAPVLQTGGGEPAAPDPEVAAPATTRPIEGWFPSGGQGAACREPVGVDLAPGYRASLTINGIPIPDDELNREGAGATLNHVTWGPEEDCPRGTVLRPEGNVVEACVWRVEDRPDNCTTYRFEFQTL